MSEIQPESLTTSDAPEKRTLLGKYELGRLLGHGAFAKVYHARDTRTGHSVAVKAVRKTRVEKDGLNPSVKREISIMQRLRHPHIIRIIEVLATKTKVYFIMDFAKGGELFAKIAKGRFSEDLSRRYFQQLISAIGYCHVRGVFHRDLKLENLLLDENWDLKITDFGLSAVKNSNSNNNPVLRTLCGTPAYVAPEILGKKGYFGDKADVWSCGIILFVLTAGYLPFNDNNLMRLYKMIYKGEFRCPRWMSGELKHLLKRLLDVNPHTRITIEEIINDPWFKKGYKEIHSIFYDDDLMKQVEGGDMNEANSRFLNAFDLISFSPGFNLSGLFTDNKGENCRETFLSTEEAIKIVERAEEVAHEVKSPRVVMERVKGGMGVRMEGIRGYFGLVVEVHRLTEELVMVEVRWREKDVGLGRDYWKEKLRPKMCHLIYQLVRVDNGIV
ncbi:CBL-interacting serine/threonine-protein kinase 14-like [Silene latifolia]|uniref:CBL-interacting serine/threonine-protein kinase 14-like n=1 Tax=Silene latifolia TaxID=37657 RepID=UPI003D782443